MMAPPHCLQSMEMEQIMSYDEHPSYIPHLVHGANFPVYGLVNHPLDLSICSCGEGESGESLTLYNVSFTFSSPHYPEERDNFELGSIDATVERQEDARIIYELKDPSEGPIFDLDTTLFQSYHLRSEEQAHAGPPFVWEETISLAGGVFLGTFRHWSHPRQLSLFLLKAEETVLSGRAYGPSQEELLFLLRSLQVINHQDHLLREYQRELDQETERLFGKRA